MVSGLSFCGPWLGSALLDATVFLKPASPRGAQDAGPQFPISPRGQHPPQLPVQMSQDPLPTGATSVFSTTPYTECDAWALVFLEHTASYQGLDILSLCPRQPQVRSFLSGLPPHLSILAGLPL